MPTIGPMIAASARLSGAMAQRLLKDIQPSQFARFASIGDTMIQSNHPAFIFGHLSLYSARVIEQLGGDASAYQPSPRYQELFSKDARCVDDPHGTVYPPMEELTATLLSGHQAAIAALESAADEQFQLENPNQAMRERFPTQGAMHAFYVGGHFMMHMGQMSAWRRAMGMGPA